MLNVGVIGYGYWGPNIVRNFTAIKNCNLITISDVNEEALMKAKELYPYIDLTTNNHEVSKSKAIDLVAIVTPVSTHYKLTKEALENGKHVFVEKPFTQTLEEAQELIEIANRKKLQIMVDHTFLFTGAVQKIKELVDEGELGDLYYYDSTRVSLGLFQQDVNVIWDLAPHDFSIMDYVLKDKPVAVTANGVDHFGKEKENIAYISLYYPNNVMGHVNVNWLSPVKVRTTLLAGQNKMLLWDDLQADEKLKIYDKGVDLDNREGLYKLWIEYRAGDMWAPRLDRSEALKKELEYFIDCIENDQTPINDGEAGLRVVELLTATNESLKNEGKMIKL